MSLQTDGVLFDFRMPRPTKLTKSLGNQVLSLVKQGLPLELAAEAHHVKRATALEWVRRGEGRVEGRPATPLYIAFAEGYRAARAWWAQLCTQACLTAITGLRKSRRTGNLVRAGAATAAMRAAHAQWQLARRFPEFWGGGREHVTVDVEASLGDEKQNGSFHINVIVSPDEPEAEESETSSLGGGMGGGMPSRSSALGKMYRG